MIRSGLRWSLKPLSGRRVFSEAAKAGESQGTDADLFVVAEDELEANERAYQLERSRNKSRLKPLHFNMLHGIVPKEHVHDYHYDVKYQRRLYGLHGEKSGVDPKVCWMNKNALAEKKEYERVAHDRTLEQMIEIVNENKRQREAAVREREELILSRMAKLEQWKVELKNKIAKKEAAASLAKAKREKLIEEVRREFGFKIDPKDDRFQTLLEEKEKQQRKAEKLAKRAAKEAQLILNLQKKNAEIQ